MSKEEKKLMPLLVLAGGFGTRLSEVIQNVPKALAPVSGEPLLTRQVLNWIGQGVNDFVFLLHYRSQQIISLLNSLSDTVLRDCNVRYVVEATPLGTAGAVANAVKQLELSGELLITNADTWLSSGIKELVTVGADALLAVEQNAVSRYGSLIFDEEGFVASFHEKAGDTVKSGWINAGTSILRAEHFLGWNDRAFSLEMDLFPRLIRERKLRAVPVNIDFTDIGIPEDYYKFCDNFQ